MRGFVTGTLFAFALVLAACGGGGGSRVLPSTGSNPATPNQPATAKTTHASIKLYIPPPSKQNARSRPLYIPGNTQSFGVFVEPYPSVAPSIGPSSTPPAGIQIFPVATPSPCAVASGGGYACTLSVTANVGSDLFVVVAFAVANPSAGSVPLSAYLSGPVTVSLSPAPNATPLTFTLNGVVNSVAVAVASPDPKNTPNTQVFTALVPTSAPLAITALDSSGNIVMSPATLPFFNPVAIQASPASDGVTLALIGSSACGSSASGATAQINCVGDLNNVQAVYDGSTHPDANDRAIDTFKVYSTNAPNPTPSPASIVLASNVVTYPINTGKSSVSNGFLMLNPSSSQLLYGFNAGSTPEIGTFTIPTATVGAPVTLNGVSRIAAMAIAPKGTLWVEDNGDESSDVIDCWSTVQDALNGDAPNTSGIIPRGPDGYEIYFNALTVDSANNVWFAGYDGNTGLVEYAGYFSAASGCPASAPTVTAQFELSGDTGDESPFAAPLASGMAFVSGTALFEVTTSSPSSVTGIAPALASATSGGVSTDGTGNVYAAFRNSNAADAEWAAAGTSMLSSLLSLVPTSAVDGASASPYGLAVFSPTSTTADRLAYVDDRFEALGLGDNLHATPATLLEALPNADDVFAVAYGPNGAPYILYLEYTTGSTLNIARAVTTTTWWEPVTSSRGGACGTGALVSINERGDSGPFTVVASPSPGSASATVTQFPGSDHDYFISPSGSASATMQLTITDKNGRTQVVPNFTASEGESC